MTEVDSELKGMTPDLLAKQSTFFLDHEPSKYRGKPKTTATVAGPDIDAAPVRASGFSRRNVGGKRAKRDDSLDELALLRESQRIARIGSWWRTATEPAWWSEEMYRIYGVSPDTFVPTREALLKLIHPDDRGAVLAWFDAYQTGDKCDELEFRAIRPDGSIRWINAHVCQETAAGKKSANFVGTAQDVTDRKHMEQNLVAALDYNRLLIDVSPVGVIVYNSKGDGVSANEAVAKIIGGTVDAVKKQNFRRLRSWKKSGLLELAETALADNCVVESDVHLNPSTFGKESWMRARLVPFHYNHEQHLLGLFSDITEKKRIEGQNKLYVAKLETAFMQTVEVITALSAMRDPYTAGHERRVAEIAVAIGAETGFDARRQQGLRVAGYLHDIGKINIPGEILSKPGRISPVEFALVKEHPRAGYDVLKNVEFPWPVALVALQHHEKMDGSGYPQGLQGDEIILEGRIMAVADVIESMSSHRPYRPALGIKKALAEIERGRGTAFDADVTDACLRLFRVSRYKLPA